MPRPMMGTQQATAGLDMVALRSRAWLNWRNVDGTIAPLTGQAAQLSVRAAAATVFDSNGTSVSMPRSAAAWSAEDWDGDSVREELLLVLGAGEVIRCSDRDSGQLVWPVRPLTVQHEWMWDGAGPLWSLTNDAASGAHLRLDAQSDGSVRWLHHNGTAPEESTVSLGITAGTRCSVRAHLLANGAVQAFLVRNGGAELVGAASPALTPAALWGGGSGVQARINGFGTSSVGAQRLRTCAVYPGLATRYDLEHAL